MTVAGDSRPVDILLVEDNPGDARLAQEAFRYASIPSRIHVVPNGVEAMDFLRGQAGYCNAPRPDLILLDLNLPKKSGREVLAEIKTDPQLRQIPVIILTSSTSEEDISQSYSLHAACYLTKPLEFDDFIDQIKRTGDFWLRTAKLPPKRKQLQAV